MAVYFTDKKISEVSIQEMLGLKLLDFELWTKRLKDGTILEHVGSFFTDRIYVGGHLKKITVLLLTNDKKFGHLKFLADNCRGLTRITENNIPVK